MRDLTPNGIYRSTLYKYRKFKRRLDKSIVTGKFYRYTRRKQNELIRRIERLRRRLAALSTELKLGGAAAAVALMLNSNSVQAQSTLGPFNERPIENPLRPPIYTSNNSAPFLVDFDGDGDLDLFVGTYEEQILYYINKGTKEKPVYAMPDENEDPLSNISWPSETYFTSPALSNLDADSDLEMVVADYYGRLYYFDIVNGKFVDKTLVSNPFASVILPSNYNTRPKLTFADLDGDGDKDLFIGLYDVYADDYVIMEAKNTGGTFGAASEASWAGSLSLPSYPSPTFGDLDGDGDLDLVVGGSSGGIFYYRNTSRSSIGGATGSIGFVEETGFFVPSTTSANPTGNPFALQNVNSDAVPFLADIDGDGDLDLAVGLYWYDGYYINKHHPVQYLENAGLTNEAPFKFKYDLESPFDGVDVGYNALMSIGNIDKEGDTDIIMLGIDFSGKYSYDRLLYLYRHQNLLGAFRNKADDVEFVPDPAPISGNASPIFVDLDNDGDSDVVLGGINPPRYFVNNDGVFEEKTGGDNPFGIVGYGEGLAFADLDGDGLKDMLNSEGTEATYYKNTGTASAPQFTETTLAGELTGSLGYYLYGSHPVFIDLDNDKDLDLVLGKYNYNIHYFENTGTPTSPSFKWYDENDANNPMLNLNGINYFLDPDFLDVDKDGDLDVLVAHGYGQVVYYKNENPTPTITVASSILAYTNQPTAIDATLTLADGDNDMIVKATIQVVNYTAGDDVLSFTPQSPVSGSFDAATGILTLSGKASVSVYQSVLRTVTYEFKGTLAGGRKGGRAKASNKQMDFRVYDSDLTTPPAKIRTISVGTTNQPPVISKNTLNTILGGKVTINLTDIISDPDDNLDPDSFEIIPNISPTPPTVGLASLTNSELIIDYTGLSFTGNDFITINACDLDGSCSMAEIKIEVAGDIIVYNGISPNGDELNEFFHIRYIDLLSPKNKVAIYNRWGDKVFEISDYNNDTRRFEGKNDNGKELPGGVYFYIIEQTDKPKVTGYLTLK